MMRLLMEAVMVIGVVLVIIMLMKLNVKTDDSNARLPDDTDNHNDD